MSRIARVASAAADRAGPLVTGLAASLRAAVRSESRRRRLRWLAVAGVLVLGPLAFNLARESDYEASVALFPTAVEPYPPIRDPGYYRSLLADPVLREQMRVNLGRPTDYHGVSIRRGSETAQLILTAAAEVPERAQTIVNALAPQIAGATQRQLARIANRDTERVGERLSSTSLSTEDRRTLQRRLRRLQQFGEFPPPRVLPGVLAPRPPIDGWADELVDGLPGDFSARPNPLWAALAGLLVAVTLWAICLVLVLPAGRREGAP